MEGQELGRRGVGNHRSLDDYIGLDTRAGSGLGSMAEGDCQPHRQKTQNHRQHHPDRQVQVGHGWRFSNNGALQWLTQSSGVSPTRHIGHTPCIKSMRQPEESRSQGQRLPFAISRRVQCGQPALAEPGTVATDEEARHRPLSHHTRNRGQPERSRPGRHRRL